MGKDMILIVYIPLNTLSRSSSPPHGHSSHSVPTEEVREKDRKE